MRPREVYPSLGEVLRHLRGLPRARFSDHHEHLVIVHRADELLAQLEDGQTLALLLHGERGLLAKRGRLTKRLYFPLRHLVPAQSDAAELLREVPLALFRHRILPRSVQIPRHRVQRRSLLLLLELSSLLRERRLRHRRAAATRPDSSRS